MSALGGLFSAPIHRRKKYSTIQKHAHAVRTPKIVCLEPNGIFTSSVPVSIYATSILEFRLTLNDEFNAVTMSISERIKLPEQEIVRIRRMSR